MNTTKEQRKLKAIELMKKLDIYKPYINDFKLKDWTCYYEGFAGFWTWQDKELQNKVKEIEEKHNCTVYAITHDITEIGEMYSFLLVSDYPEEWDYLITKFGQDNHCFAYVWNKNDDLCSEFGDVLIQSYGGGIGRIA